MILLLFSHCGIVSSNKKQKQINCLTIMDSMLWKMFWKISSKMRSSKFPVHLYVMYQQNERKKTWLYAWFNKNVGHFNTIVKKMNKRRLFTIPLHTEIITIYKAFVIDISEDILANWTAVSRLNLSETKQKTSPDWWVWSYLYTVVFDIWNYVNVFF